jgi:metal-responsive CopG/Arc/MetJ family transcriptional regulator
MQTPRNPVMVRLDDEDLAALDKCCALEKLKRSDVVGRAVRAYLEKLQGKAEK